MRKINIAIDGPVASGKSTIAKLLAKRLGYTHIDTGAMYRCVALSAIQQHVPLDDENKLTELSATLNIELHANGVVVCDGQDVTQALRSNGVSTAASLVSVFSGVRKQLVKQQQHIAQHKGIVMDGRDIGTVVLPNAELKIFQTASVASRANRRYQENLKKNIKSPYHELTKEINERDYADTHREQSPLRQAEDAVVIDTSNLSIEEVVAIIETHARRVINHD